MAFPGNGLSCVARARNSVVVAAAGSVFRLVECRDVGFEVDFVEKLRMALIRIPYVVFQAPSSHHLDAKIDEICCLQSFSTKFARRRHTPPRSLITKSIVSTSSCLGVTLLKQRNRPIRSMRGGVYRTGTHLLHLRCIDRMAQKRKSRQPIGMAAFYLVAGVGFEPTTFRL